MQEIHIEDEELMEEEKKEKGNGAIKTEGINEIEDTKQNSELTNRISYLGI